MTANEHKLEILHRPDNTCQTFALHGEDHTLGNALRHMIMKNTKVEFCGYTVPHPLENKIHLRIQTDGQAATVALQKGLKDLHKLCEDVLATFKGEIDDYMEREMEQR